MAVSWQQINCQVDLTIWAIFWGKKVNASRISLGSWIMSAPTGRTNAEDETPLLWPPNGKSWLPAKIPDAGKDWRQEEKDTTEDEMVGWHHQFNEHEFEQIPVSSEGQGSLECCSPWGCKDSETERLSDWIRGAESLVQEVKMLLDIGCSCNLLLWEWKAGKKSCYISSFCRTALNRRNF